MSILASITLCCALAILLFNVTLYRRRALALQRLPTCDAVDRLGTLDALWAFAQECAALAAVLLLIPVGWMAPRCRSGAGSRGPLLLVHGWAVNRGAFWLLRRRLLRDGWSPVCCVDYRSVRVDVEAATQRLQRALERMTAGASVAPPVTLVGHGLGGLVIRYYARRFPAQAVRRLVTLGTPHFGTEVAPSFGAVGKLAPGSSFLKTLNVGDRVPQQFDVIAIHSTFDALILPPDKARYPEAFNIQLNNVGHNALLFSARVYQLLFENLAAPLP